MAVVSILDQLHPAGSMQLNDDSPLAKSHLKSLRFDIPAVSANRAASIGSNGYWLASRV